MPRLDLALHVERILAEQALLHRRSSRPFVGGGKAVTVSFPEVKTTVSYATALHTIGLAVLFRSMPSTAEQDAEAWEWALGKALPSGVEREFRKKVRESLQRHAAKFASPDNPSGRPRELQPPEDHVFWSLLNTGTLPRRDATVERRRFDGDLNASLLRVRSIQERVQDPSFEAAELMTTKLLVAELFHERSGDGLRPKTFAEPARQVALPVAYLAAQTDGGFGAFRQLLNKDPIVVERLLSQHTELADALAGHYELASKALDFVDYTTKRPTIWLALDIAAAGRMRVDPTIDLTPDEVAHIEQGDLGR